MVHFDEHAIVNIPKVEHRLLVYHFFWRNKFKGQFIWYQKSRYQLGFDLWFYIQFLLDSMTGYFPLENLVLNLWITLKDKSQHNHYDFPPKGQVLPTILQKGLSKFVFSFSLTNKTLCQ